MFLADVTVVKELLLYVHLRVRFVACKSAKRQRIKSLFATLF